MVKSSIAHDYAGKGWSWQILHNSLFKAIGERRTICLCIYWFRGSPNRWLYYSPRTINENINFYFYKNNYENNNLTFNKLLKNKFILHIEYQI